jgi:hypothetical protein
MSWKIRSWNLLEDISEQQQELIHGGNQPQISNNNFTQTTANTTQDNNSNLLGNISQATTDFFDVNSAARSLLSSDVIRMNNSGDINSLIPNPVPSVQLNNTGGR